MISFSPAREKVAFSYAMLATTLVLSFALANRYTILLGLPCACGIFCQANYFLLILTLSANAGRSYRAKLLGMTGGGLLLFVILSRCILYVLPVDPSSVARHIIWEKQIPREVIFTWMICCMVMVVKLPRQLEWVVPSTFRHPFFYALSAGVLSHLVMFMIAGGADPEICQLIQGNLYGFVLSSIVGAIILLPFCKTISVKTRQELAYQSLLWLFCYACIFANLLIVKRVLLGSSVVTAALFIYGLTFVFTDVLAELYGASSSILAVRAGCWSNVILLVIIGLVARFPCHTFSPTDDGMFQQSCSFVAAAALGSMVAFFIAQIIDIYLFDLLRKKTQSRHLWLRNNLATLFSQGVDTVIFASITWGIWTFCSSTTPSLSWETWWKLSLNEYCWKMVLSLLDTPFVYLLLYLFRSWISRDSQEHVAKKPCYTI